jgi:transposase-like protein
MTFNHLLVQFPEDNACKSYLMQRRWPNGVTCPKCHNVNVWQVRHRSFHWICKKCNTNGYRFSVITKTIFENTKYPLAEWFKVIFIVCSSGNAMSALQIQRILGTGSYRTAWYLRRRICAAIPDVAAARHRFG